MQWRTPKLFPMDKAKYKKIIYELSKTQTIGQYIKLEFWE